MKKAGIWDSFVITGNVFYAEGPVGKKFSSVNNTGRIYMKL
jgi:hypothetical protein